MLSSASLQVSSGMQILAAGAGDGKPTRLVSDYCCFRSALVFQCSTNRYSGKHAHHTQCPPALGGRVNSPSTKRMIILNTFSAKSRLLLSSSDFLASLGVLVAEGHPSLLQ